MTPFQEALQYIRENDGSAALGLAKLILSIGDSEAAFSIRECVTPFDSVRWDICRRMIDYFHEHGEDSIISNCVWETRKIFSGLLEIGIAGTVAAQKHSKRYPVRRDHPLTSKKG